MPAMVGGDAWSGGGDGDLKGRMVEGRMGGSTNIFFSNIFFLGFQFGLSRRRRRGVQSR